jgi:hypothetical protein
MNILISCTSSEMIKPYNGLQKSEISAKEKIGKAAIYYKSDICGMNTI